MKWVFILGGSSGFGLASARLFADKGYNLFIVHRDRKGNMPEIERSFQLMREKGISVVNINTNVNTADGQEQIIAKLKETLKETEKICVFLHSLADGNINPLIGSLSKNSFFTLLSEDDITHTIHAMGSSFLLWSRLLHDHGFFHNPARIIGITSEGSHKVIPGYAAVAAAKSVLESGCRYLASELAPFGITTNLINAGITETPALKAIPSSQKIIETAIRRNPFKRLTLPEDVAKVICLLATDEAGWINGEIIRVDGGEQLMM
ncbi:MAG: SDR family oxidoreductase [Bacteroidota bacterium]